MLGGYKRWRNISFFFIWSREIQLYLFINSKVPETKNLIPYECYIQYTALFSSHIFSAFYIYTFKQFCPLCLEITQTQLCYRLLFLINSLNSECLTHLPCLNSPADGTKIKCGWIISLYSRECAILNHLTIKHYKIKRMKLISLRFIIA